VLLLLVYLIGSAQFGNLTKNAALDSDVNAPYEQWFHGGMHEFMHALPRAGLFFTGIQNINLACREIREPKSEVPKAYMAGLGTGLLTSFVTVLVACSLSPGVSYLKTRLYPLSTGYMLMFEITRPHAIIISLPAVIAAGLGFVYFYGQKLRAMGESRLMNPICAGELPGRHTPINALLIGSALSFALCMLEYFEPEVGLYLYNISVMGAFFTYMSIFLSFLSFRAYYPTITKEFKSPLGAVGAYYGMAVFALAIVSICGFQKKQVSITTFSCVLGVAIVYYYWAVEKRQVFSEEEKKVMFKAYLLKGTGHITSSSTIHLLILTVSTTSAVTTGNASKATRLKKGARAGRGARGEVPTPRSDNGKKEIFTTIVYKAAPTETMSAPAVYLSDEEQPPLAARGAEEPTYRMSKQGLEEGVTAVVWEKEHENENENENEDGSEHDVPELPV
jgi:amino acid permease